MLVLLLAFDVARSHVQQVCSVTSPTLPNRVTLMIGTYHGQNGNVAGELKVKSMDGATYWFQQDSKCYDAGVNTVSSLDMDRTDIGKFTASMQRTTDSTSCGNQVYANRLLTDSQSFVTCFENDATPKIADEIYFGIDYGSSGSQTCLYSSSKKYVSVWYYFVLDNLPTGQLLSLSGTTNNQDLAPKSSCGSGPFTMLTQSSTLSSFGTETYITLSVANGRQSCTTTPNFAANTVLASQGPCTLGHDASQNAQDFFDGTVCPLKCETGYRGTGRLECEDGNWKNTFECVPNEKACFIPLDPNHAQRTRLDGLVRGLVFDNQGCGVYTKEGTSCDVACERRVNEIQALVFPDDAGATYALKFTDANNNVVISNQRLDVHVDTAGFAQNIATLMNFHTSSVEVQLTVKNSKRTYRVEFIGMDAAGDVPLLQIDNWQKANSNTAPTSSTRQAGKTGYFATGKIDCIYNSTQSSNAFWAPSTTSVPHCTADSNDSPKVSPTVTSVSLQQDNNNHAFLQVSWLKPTQCQNGQACSSVTKYFVSAHHDTNTSLAFTITCPDAIGETPTTGGLKCNIAGNVSVGDKIIVTVLAQNGGGVSSNPDSYSLISSATWSAPSMAPTAAPTNAPTKAPTKAPTTKAPTKAPTKKPTKKPTKAPTTKAPTKAPTTAPSNAPTFRATTSSNALSDGDIAGITVASVGLVFAGICAAGALLVLVILSGVVVVVIIIISIKKQTRHEKEEGQEMAVISGLKLVVSDSDEPQAAAVETEDDAEALEFLAEVAQEDVGKEIMSESAVVKNDGNGEEEDAVDALNANDNEVVDEEDVSRGESGEKEEAAEEIEVEVVLQEQNDKNNEEEAAAAAAVSQIEVDVKAGAAGDNGENAADAIPVVTKEDGSTEPFSSADAKEVGDDASATEEKNDDGIDEKVATEGDDN